MSANQQTEDESMAKFVMLRHDHVSKVYVNMDQVRFILPAKVGSMVVFDSTHAMTVLDDPATIANEIGASVD